MRKFSFRDILLAVLTAICGLIGGKEAISYARGPQPPEVIVSDPVDNDGPQSAPDDDEERPRIPFMVAFSADTVRTATPKGLPEFEYTESIFRVKTVRAFMMPKVADLGLDSTYKNVKIQYIKPLK